jgi:hypothetical protein
VPLQHEEGRAASGPRGLFSDVSADDPKNVHPGAAAGRICRFDYVAGFATPNAAPVAVGQSERNGRRVSQDVALRATLPNRNATNKKHAR